MAEVLVATYEEQLAGSLGADAVVDGHNCWSHALLIHRRDGGRAYKLVVLVELQAVTLLQIGLLFHREHDVIELSQHLPVLEVNF